MCCGVSVADVVGVAMANFLHSSVIVRMKRWRSVLYGDIGLILSADIVTRLT